MAKLITVSKFRHIEQECSDCGRPDLQEVGRFVGTFTQLKLALAYINLDGLTVGGRKARPATYDRISAEMRKSDKNMAVLHDGRGFRAYALRKNELNPQKEVTDDSRDD
jgi:hypothetical protein